MKKVICILIIQFVITYCQAKVDGSDAEVLPMTPQLVDVTLSNYDFNLERPGESFCDCTIRMVTQHASQILVCVYNDIYDSCTPGWYVLYPIEMSTMPDTVSIFFEELCIPYEGLSFSAVYNNYRVSEWTRVYFMREFMTDEDYCNIIDTYLGINDATETEVSVKKSGNYLACMASEDVMSMTLLGLDGQKLSHSKYGRLAIPANVRHGMYILYIKLKNKSITKKIKL